MNETELGLGKLDRGEGTSIDLLNSYINNKYWLTHNSLHLLSNPLGESSALAYINHKLLELPEIFQN